MIDVSHQRTALSGESKVLTEAGARLASEIRIGDRVLTHAGLYRRVTSIVRRAWAGELVVLRPHGTLGASCELAPWACVLGRRVTRPRGCPRALGSPEFLSVQSLRANDRVGFPAVLSSPGASARFLDAVLSPERPSLPHGDRLLAQVEGEPLWFLLGAWMASGSAPPNNKGIFLAVGSPASDFACSVRGALTALGLTWGELRDAPHSIRLRIASGALRTVAHALGAASAQRHVPEALQALEAPQLGWLLRGFYAAYGSAVPGLEVNPAVKIHARALAEGIQRLLLREGVFAGVSRLPHDGSHARYLGPNFAARSRWMLRPYGDLRGPMASVRFDPAYPPVWWIKLRAVERRQSPGCTLLGFVLEGGDTFCSTLVTHRAAPRAEASRRTP